MRCSSVCSWGGYATLNATRTVGSLHRHTTVVCDPAPARGCTPVGLPVADLGVQRLLNLAGQCPAGLRVLAGRDRPGSGSVTVKQNECGCRATVTVFSTLPPAKLFTRQNRQFYTLLRAINNETTFLFWKQMSNKVGAKLQHDTCPDLAANVAKLKTCAGKREVRCLQYADIKQAEIESNIGEFGVFLVMHVLG